MLKSLHFLCPHSHGFGKKKKDLPFLNTINNESKMFKINHPAFAVTMMKSNSQNEYEFYIT